VHEEIWRKERCAVSHHGKQMTHHTTRLIGTYSHIRFHLGSGGTDKKQLTAVEEIGLFHLWHQVYATINIGLYTIHATKIQIILFLPKKKRNFVAKIMILL
jgi:hypothetical protein